MLMYVLRVINLPCLASLAGQTQSNMSTPESIKSIKPTVSPRPITYLGLSIGSIEFKCSTTFFLSVLVSPIANPPIAYPSKSNSIIDFAEVSLKSRFKPP